jgi:hypothetical protein
MPNRKSMRYGNHGVMSVSDVSRYVTIRMLLDSIFDKRTLVFIRRWEIKSYRWLFFRKVAYVRCDYLGSLLDISLRGAESVFEKLTVAQVPKKFPAFYGTRMFIISFITARKKKKNIPLPDECSPHHIMRYL